MRDYHGWDGFWRLACLAVVFSLVRPSAAVPAGAPALARARLPFMANSGWADQRVAYAVRTMAGMVYVTQSGALLYALPSPGQSAPDDTGMGIVSESIRGAGPVSLRGRQPASARVSVFHGADARRWRSDVPSFYAVEWADALPGVHVIWRACGNNVEKIFTILPGADPREIQLELAGANRLHVDAAGRLIARTEHGELIFTAPAAYQAGVMGYEPVAVRYEVCGARYGFALGAYDPTRPLVIDPLLGGTYLGGHESDGAYAMALDGLGRVYIAGSTGSPDFPCTPGAFQTNQHGVFVSLFDNDLTNLLASTYLGGSGFESACAIALDPAGRVYLSGTTDSTNFPTTPGAYQTEISPYDPEVPNYDVFVAVLSADLSQLQACTLLGGDGQDWGRTLAIDGWTNVYVAGVTPSSNFPTTDGAFQRVLRGHADGFIAKFNNGLTHLTASTYLGGSDYENLESVKLRADGSVYAAGVTSSTNFPATNFPYAAALAGGDDCFVARLDSSLQTLHNATYLGGGSNEWPNALILASGGCIYLAGYTCSTDFPTTVDAWQPVSPGGDHENYHGFVARFSADLSVVHNSTFLGGSAGYSQVQAMLQDNAGNIWVAGYTSASNFPTTAGAYSRTLQMPPDAPYAEPDCFIARLGVDLVWLHISTLLGGRRADHAHAMQLDNAGNVFVAGYTESADFPTAPGSYEREYHVPLNFWYGDAFVSKLDGSMGDFPAPPVNAAASDCVYADRVRLSWTAADRTEGYTVWRGLSSDTGNAGKLAEVDAETVSYIDRTAEPGVFYNYWVKATNSSGASVFSRPAAGRRSGTAPVAADFDGDGLADPAIVVEGFWQVWQSSAGYALVGPVLGDAANRTFAAGDFDGDGRADPGAMDGGGVWKAWLSRSQYAPVMHALAAAGGSAVAADFDGDGLADPAVYLADTWYFWMSTAAYAQMAQFAVGAYPDAISLAADFDGDGLADPALFDPGTGVWTVWLSGNWYEAYSPSLPLAEPDALPAVGDFDGDGCADIAACKLGSGKWYIWLSSQGYVQSGPYL